VNELLPSLAGILLFLLPGLGLAELVPGLRALPLPRRLGYAWLLGVTAVAGTLYVASHLWGVPLRRPAILIVAGLPVLAGLCQSLVRSVRLRSPSPGEGGRGGGRGGQGVRALWAAPLFLICLGLFADAVTNPVTGWDGRMIWSTQARYVRAEGTVDAATLREARWYVNHPRYPLLLPVAQAAVLELTGAADDRQVFRPLYAAFFPALLLVLWDAASAWAGPSAARLAALAAAGAPALTFWQDGGAASAYSDLPLGCFAGAGLLLLLRSRRRLADAAAAGLLLAGAVLTKNEGALLALFVPLAAAVVLLGRLCGNRSRGRQIARLLLAAAPALLALAFLASWRAGIPNRYDEGYAGFVRPGAFWPAVVTRIPDLAPLAAAQMLAWDPWAAFWWIIPPALVTGRRAFNGRRRHLAATLILTICAPLAIGWGAYSVHWDPAPLLRVTWTRFLVQGALPLLVLSSLAARGLLRLARLARNSH
jgi:hypothetical protein